MRGKIIFDYNKLRGRIIEKFRSQSNFAAANNLTDRSMSLKLNNGIGLSQDEIMRWSDLLDISRADIPEYFFCLKSFKNETERRKEDAGKNNLRL